MTHSAFGLIDQKILIGKLLKNREFSLDYFKLHK